MNSTPIGVNINFDSLNEAFGFPKGYRDPSFFEVFDRFLEFSTTYNFKYSIYIIGKDIQNPEIYNRVKEWNDMGHEIGNHSWSHHMNLGALPYNELEKEILKSHELITKCTGFEPKGFIAPAWSTSTNLWNILIENNYLYDSSVFPSYLFYLMMGKIAFNHRKDRVKLKKILNRKDWLNPIFKKKTPFKYENKQGELLILPVPSSSKMCFPFWQTLFFIFNQDRTLKMLDKLLESYDYFYYLLHPADLIDAKDIIDVKEKHSLERMTVSIAEKKKYMKKAFDLIAASNREIVTMEELSKRIISDLSVFYK